jgi:hypothetical protein
MALPQREEPDADGEAEEELAGRRLAMGRGMSERVRIRFM